MALVKTEIVDTAFAHAPGMSWYHRPAYIEWIRGTRGDADVCFFTDRSIGKAKGHPAKKKIALILEPRCIDEVGLLSVIECADQLTHVLSYDTSYKDIVTEPGKLLWYPIGGCWIEEKNQHLQHTKTELVTMVASDKNWAPGHKLRHIIAGAFKDKVHLYGRGYKPVDRKSEVLNRSMFSVAVENDVVSTMFTEKLIDCFVTGTVPIYWGTENIGDYFDMRGVLTFKTPEDFERVLGNLSTDLYVSMKPYIAENYYRALNYTVAEDWLFKNYKSLFI